ncbi:hypothetical protein YQE_12935, partial [Dendroctonus ponderosae]
MSVPFLGRRRSSSIKKEFSEKELNELRIAFDLLDRNQDGQVTTREFKIMLNNLGIDLKQNKVDELIRSASHAGKELIDENDFLKFVKQIQDLCDLRNSKDDDEQDLVAAFTVFDMDNDGYITKDELRIAMEMIGEEVSEDQLTHIMEVADTDKDGKINYEVRATNPNNPEVDTAALNAFYALINREKDGPPLGVRVIASRLPAGCEKEVLSTLNVLDACMQKCGSEFQSEVGKFRFLNEMIKLVSPKYLGSKTPISVKHRVLQLLYLWTLDYPTEVKIKEAFDMLRKQGVIREIPNPNIPQEALGIEPKKRVGNSIFQDEEKANILRKLLQSKDPEDIQAANWLIKSMVKEDEKLADLKSKTFFEIESFQNNVKLLNEMVGSYKTEDTTRSELDLMSELHDNLIRFKPNLESIVCSDQNWPMDLIESVLKTIDDVSECCKRYKETVHDSKGSNFTSLMELDQQSVAAASSATFIQMDGVKEPKSSTEDCSCSSQISSNTSKSSMDVLCDVFSGLGDVAEDTILQPVPVAANAEQAPVDKGKNLHKKVNALEDLDVLSEHLLKENIPLSNYRNQDKVPMNLLTKINEVKKSQVQSQSAKVDLNYLLPNSKSASSSCSKSEENLSQLDNSDDCLVDISEDKDTLSVLEKDHGLEPCKDQKHVSNGTGLTTKEAEKDRMRPAIKLNDISMKLEDIKPSSGKSIVGLDDKNGLCILLHKAADAPKPLVAVYVVTTISRKALALQNYLFQAVAPKGCKLRLLPPSTTDLPAFNPFLPPAAITQILLIGNQDNQKEVSLKFVISYVMDDETVTEMGEVPNLPLEP